VVLAAEALDQQEILVLRQLQVQLTQGAEAVAVQ
jgi:hypothetical protein